MKCNYRWMLALLITFLQGQAQENGAATSKNITASDFSSSSFLISPGTGVIILSDIGHSALTCEEDGWIVTYTRTRRLRILNRNGLDACTVSLGFSAEDNTNRKLKSLKASTYNLVAGKIEKTDLDPQQVFLARAKNSEQQTESFTMPNAREGSVIEYSYSIKSSDIENLSPWYFQGDYPRIFSQYSVSIPAFFNYAITSNGKLAYARKTIDSTLQNVWIGSGHIDSYIYNISWEMKDVPAVQQESFVHRPEASYANLAFQISAAPDRYGRPFAVLRSWPKITHMLLQRDIFNESGRKQKQLSNLVASITSGATGEPEKAKRIFHFVRDSLNCTHAYGWPYLGPAETVKTRSANGGDLSLLLSTMLNDAGISASVLMLATNKNEPLSPIYPFPNNINRLVVNAQIGGKAVFLDPAHKNLAFGFLPPEYYNGFAINLNPEASAVFMDPDGFQEKTFTEIDAHLSDSGTVQVAVLVRDGEYSSFFTREKYKAEGNDAGIFESLAKSLQFTGRLHGSLESANNPDSRINLHYTASLQPGDGDLIYLNSMLNHNMKNNPFSAAVRQCAVEFDYPREDIYDLVIPLPKGYQVETVPQSDIVKLNDKDGLFEYNFSVNDQELHLYCRLKMNKTAFTPAEYDKLRNFYASVLEKEGQMIVLKKK